MKTLKLIKQLYPYQFEGKHLDLSIAKGWLPEFAELCKNVDELLGENKRGFHWVQLKEKFGSARYYWSIDGKDDSFRVDVFEPKKVVSFEMSPTGKKDQQDLFDHLSKIIRSAEAATNDHCIACGALGKVDKQDGYLLVLCETHTKNRSAGDDFDIWPNEDDE